MNYFSVNAVIGGGMTGPGDFPTAESLVRHLDYIGVDRTLVYSMNALDRSPINGNKTLLDDIASYPDRLIPSFVISPADYYENGSIAFLREKAKSGEVRAFRLSTAFRVKNYERVIAELEEFSPVFLKNTGYADDALNDLEAIARQYPKATFILCKQMWNGLGNALDLMWRCKNVCLEISWLHVRGSFELIRDEFGIERLLFGVDCKAHHGAAIGALAHADFAPGERELVAHGNIERLLGLRPLGRKLAPEHPLLKEKPLWTAFRNGRKIDSVKIYDAHSHFGGTNGSWIGRDFNDLDAQLRAVSGNMDKYGIAKMVVAIGLGSNPIEAALDFERRAREYPGKFLGYLGYNPFYKNFLTRQALDDLFSRETFVGFKTLCSYWKIKINDPAFEPMWEYAEEHHLPILNHTWDDSYNSPSMLTDVARKYPHAKFILGHSGGGTRGRLESEALAKSCPNVFLEFCGTFCSNRPVSESIREVGIGQFVFGSDTNGHNVAYELGGFLSLPMPDKDLIPALGENMEKILADRR